MPQTHKGPLMQLCSDILINKSNQAEKGGERIAELGNNNLYYKLVMTKG